MTVLSGEGTHQVLYGSTDIYAGMRRNRGYVARPDHAGSFPPILVAHDVWGIASYVKELTWRLARHGLAVVVPDLYRGASPDRRGSFEDARRAFQALTGTSRLLDDAHEFIASSDTPWARPGALGVLALGAGAGLATTFASARPVDAIGIVAGAGHDRLPGGVPAIAIHSKSDTVAPLPEPRPAHIGWVLYENIPHDFLNDHGPDYSFPAARDAGDRLIQFFTTNLST